MDDSSNGIGFLVPAAAIRPMESRSALCEKDEPKKPVRRTAAEPAAESETEDAASGIAAETHQFDDLA